MVEGLKVRVLWCEKGGSGTDSNRLIDIEVEVSIACETSRSYEAVGGEDGSMGDNIGRGVGGSRMDSLREVLWGVKYGVDSKNVTSTLR